MDAALTNTQLASTTLFHDVHTQLHNLSREISLLDLNLTNGQLVFTILQHDTCALINQTLDRLGNMDLAITNTQLLCIALSHDDHAQLRDLSGAISLLYRNFINGQLVSTALLHDLAEEVSETYARLEIVDRDHSNSQILLTWLLYDIRDNFDAALTTHLGLAEDLSPQVMTTMKVTNWQDGATHSLLSDVRASIETVTTATNDLRAEKKAKDSIRKVLEKYATATSDGFQVLDTEQKANKQTLAAIVERLNLHRYEDISDEDTSDDHED